VRDERVLVYSTDGNLPLPAAPRRSQPQPAAGRTLPDDGIVRVARERRRASVVTLVHGLAEIELAATGKELKRLCGTGGTGSSSSRATTARPSSPSSSSVAGG